MPENSTPTPIIQEDMPAKRVRFVNQLRDDAANLNDVREEANEDMRFINVDGGMWEGFLEQQFDTRVKLQFDIVSNFLNRFKGQ